MMHPTVKVKCLKTKGGVWQTVILKCTIDESHCPIDLEVWKNGYGLTLIEEDHLYINYPVRYRGWFNNFANGTYFYNVSPALWIGQWK